MINLILYFVSQEKIFKNLKKIQNLIFLKSKVDLYFRQEVLHTKFMVNAIIDRHRSIIPENFIFQLQTIYANTRGQRKKPGSWYLRTGSGFFKKRRFINTSYKEQLTCKKSWKSIKAFLSNCILKKGKIIIIITRRLLSRQQKGLPS